MNFASDEAKYGPRTSGATSRTSAPRRCNARGKDGKNAGPSLRHGVCNARTTYREALVTESETTDSKHAPLSTAHVIRSHHEAVLRFFRRRGATTEDSLDMAQDAYIRFLRYEGATTIESPSAMLFRIAGNVATDRVRAAAWRRRIRSLEADDLGTELASDEPSAERELAAEQMVQIVRGAIAALSPQCRTVFLMSRLDSLTYCEIAAHCGISVKTVEKHVSHALRVCAERGAASL
jgi:RNA polymerase sigma-70 factor (ECF subfamily)